MHLILALKPGALRAPAMRRRRLKAEILPARHQPSFTVS